MSKNATYGIVGVIVLLGLLLVAAQHMFHSGAGLPEPSGIGVAPPPPPSRPLPQITEAKIKSHWNALVASAPPPRGAADAPYQMIEIGDFQCPNCGRMKPLVDAMLQQSHGKLKLYFVNWPLTQIHPYALGAAEAGDAAAAQHKFWPMYDMLYADQKDLRPTLIEYDSASITGLNAAKLTSEVTTEKYKPEIDRQTAVVEATGAIATPTFLLRAPNGTFSWYVGSKSMSGQKGLMDLAESPPWGPGIPSTDVEAIVSQSDSAT